MNQIATIILPFLGLIACGFGAARLQLLTTRGVNGLMVFVAYFALPAWFLQMVAETPFSQLPNWSFLVTTTFATYCAFALAFSFGALVNGGNVPEATIKGLIGSYANIGYMAPALTVAAFGPSAAAPTALIFMFDSAMLFILVPLMMILGGTERGDATTLAKSIARRILLHPLILATLIGILVSLTGLPLPDAVDGFLGALSGTAAPVALFVIGAGLAKAWGKFSPELPVLLTMKLLVHPIIVYLLLAWIGGFDRVWVAAAVLIAALPPASEVLAVARKYKTYEAESEGAVHYGTAASIVTVTIVLSFQIGDTFPFGQFP
ncbi:MAG: AEC family transporter [Hyphomicrobiales bacterium]|nr:AEC family transporter [Hyphomicrobiales bacterium]